MSAEEKQNGYRPRLQVEYGERIRPALKDELDLANIMQVPRLLKIVVNMGVGDGARDEKILKAAEADLRIITAQQPRVTRAKLSVASFKVRKGMLVGCMVTLRGMYMYEFLERLICVAIPRIRDFRGLPSKSFDGWGNYSFGIREHTVFTEVDHGKTLQDFGMDVTLVTNAANDEHSRRLLMQFGMPIRES